MGEKIKTNSLASEAERLVSDSDEIFLQFLHEYIKKELKYLQCPEESPSHIRYVIYRSVFNKLIGRASAYQRLLLTIKGEYDATIRELERREDERTLTHSDTQTQAVNMCRTRATLLRDRILVLQKEAEDLKLEVQRRTESRGRSSWIPGVTVAQSEDPDSLQRLLEELEVRRGAVLTSRSHSVPVELLHLQEAELRHAELILLHLSSENQQLKTLYKRLRLVSHCLSSWEQQEEAPQEEVPLEELLVSRLKNIREVGAADQHGVLGLDSELFEEDEPSEENELSLITDHLHRFVELLLSAEYEDAALLAAKTPPGVLRSVHTMDLFTVVRGPPGSATSPGLAPSGSASPALLFFQALLLSLPAGVQLSSCVSLRGVLCSLEHGLLQLVVHAVTQHKLTPSEDLGDLLTEHAQKFPSAGDMCLALACTVYLGAGLHRKASLSMCRRGLTHGAAELMKHSPDLTAEDGLWLLRLCPSLVLLQLLTEPRPGSSALLPPGVACAALLVEPEHQQVALQLLDYLVGRGVLEEVMLEDGGSSLDVWLQVASLCSERRRDDLRRSIASVLLRQSGTAALSPDPEGARLMEHVFL